MGITIIKKKVPSADGIHQLSGVVYIPQGEIKGLFHVIHGMTEYIGRYNEFMTELAESGYLTFGFDNLGHGGSVNDKSELGFIAHKDGWSLLVDDAGKFADVIRKEYGENLPFILFGHSMGSFIARLTASRFNKYDKLIIMGTGGPQTEAAPGILLADVIKAVKGEKHISKFVNKMAFGSYNKRFEQETTHDWLSVDRDNIAAYEKDEFCTFKFTISAMGDLMRLTRNANRNGWFLSLDKAKPVLLLSGSDDPVGNYGSGVKKVCEKLKANGVNVSMKLYEGYRHEILNEKCKDEVFQDVLSFIS